MTGFAQANVEERQNFDESDFDTRRAGARFGTVLHGERTQTELSARFRRFWLDGDAYQDLFGLAARMRYSLGARTQLVGGLQWSDLDYDELEQRDSRLWLASAGISHVWRAALRPVGSVSVFYGEESARESGDAAKSQAERDLYGIGANLGLTFAPEWRFTAGVQYRRSEYGADNPLFDETREDDYYQAELNLHWQPNPNWRLGPHARFIDKDSNIDLFEYDREIYEFRVRYNF